MTEQPHGEFTFRQEHSPDKVHLKSKHKYLSPLCTRLVFSCPYTVHSWINTAESHTLSSCCGAPAAPVPKIGECVPDSNEEYDETGQRQDNRLETKSGLGFLEGCQSERICSSGMVWKDTNNNNIF